MSSTALSIGLRRGGRQVLQMTAAGSLTILVAALAHGLSPPTQGLVMAAWGVVVVFLHNWLEAAGKIKVILPTPAIIPVADTVAPLVAPVAGVVEVVADEGGKVTGVVRSITGAVAGAVNGLLKKGNQ